ncbi:MAG: lamin tail domain-containing protein [Anaerolineales bacterium]
MDARKRLGVYLLINVIVSALTTLLVLIIWTRFTLQNPSTSFDGGANSGNPGASQLEITGAIGAGDVANERVVISHVGSRDVSLSGWRLRDEDGNEYRFPALVLHPDAKVDIYTGPGEDTASRLYWNRQVAVWESGERVLLLDASGRTQADYLVP